MLLQLPRPQLTHCLEKEPELKEGLTTFAAMNLDTVPAEVLDMLGLTEED